MTPQAQLVIPHRRIDRRPKRPSPAALRALPTVHVAPTDLHNPALYINRDLSWLEFNERVLGQARDAAHPLLERVKFLAISAANLDEFFMIRVSTTLKKLRAGADEVAPDGTNTEQQLAAMQARARRMLDDQAAVWGSLRASLDTEAIHILDASDWSADVASYLADVFSREICPVLTPLAFDPGRPISFIPNRSINFAVAVRHAGRMKFARVKLPSVLPRFIQIPDALCPARGLTFALIEDVVRANIRDLFVGNEIESAHLFRIVRDADLEIDHDEAGDLVESVDRSLKLLQHGPISLLHVASDMPARMIHALAESLEVTDDLIVRSTHRLGLADWAQLTRVHRPELKDAPFAPRCLWRRDEDATVIFDQIRYQDLLVHHPYESFGSVETFLRAAASDPHVVAIKMTLYRIGAESPLLEVLSQAAERGKQVAVLVEIKARLDERTNIQWARRLESHGVHVVYGVAELKTHAKLCLVVRQEADGIQRYVHTGSGNYNVETGRVYTDLGLFTADPAVAADVAAIFNGLTGYSVQEEFRSLVVAPRHLRSTLRSLIAREADHARAGRPARIVIKVNAITDAGMIRALYRASQAGVDIDLLVRGICSLRPGVPGISDHIRVRSIVGRFLEHSRVYWFENGGDEQMFVGSSDLMERNLRRRVETLLPIRDARILAHVRHIVLDAYLKDTDRAMVMDAGGRYTTPAPGQTGRFNAQQFLLEFYTRDRRA